MSNSYNLAVKSMPTADLNREQSILLSMIDGGVFPCTAHVHRYGVIETELDKRNQPAA